MAQAFIYLPSISSCCDWYVSSTSRHKPSSKSQRLSTSFIGKVHFKKNPTCPRVQKNAPPPSTLTNFLPHPKRSLFQNQTLKSLLSSMHERFSHYSHQKKTLTRCGFLGTRHKLGWKVRFEIDLFQDCLVVWGKGWAGIAKNNEHPFSSYPLPKSNPPSNPPMNFPQYSDQKNAWRVYDSWQIIISDENQTGRDLILT